MEILELVAALSMPALTLVGAILGWKQSGKIDLLKTMEAAGDAIGIVRGHLEEKHGKDVKHEEKNVMSEVLKHVKEIRGHNISKKMERKVRARVRARLGSLLKRDAE